MSQLANQERETKQRWAVPGSSHDKIVRFAKITRTGDKAELASVPENSPVWSMVTSTRDNCLGQECPHYKECFVMQAR